MTNTTLTDDERELHAIAQGLAGHDPDTSDTTAHAAADTGDAAPPAWLIPDAAYDVLKWVALVVLPALAVLVQTLGPVWGWAWADPVAVTINAAALAVGVTIGASALNARHTR